MNTFTPDKQWTDNLVTAFTTDETRLFIGGIRYLIETAERHGWERCNQAQRDYTRQVIEEATKPAQPGAVEARTANGCKILIFPGRGEVITLTEEIK